MYTLSTDNWRQKLNYDYYIVIFKKLILLKK